MPPTGFHENCSGAVREFLPRILLVSPYHLSKCLDLEVCQWLLIRYYCACVGAFLEILQQPCGGGLHLEDFDRLSRFLVGIFMHA